MKTGLAALRPAFPVPRLEGRELGDVLARLRLEAARTQDAEKYKDERTERLS